MRYHRCTGSNCSAVSRSPRQAAGDPQVGTACLVLVAMRAAECQRYLPGVLGLPGDRLHQQRTAGNRLGPVIGVSQTDDITGERDGRPVKPGPTIGDTDTGTGMLMAFSIVSALFDRARTGKGRRLQVAMQDSVMHYSRGTFITQARTGAATPAQ